jgi:hypothetical protein
VLWFKYKVSPKMTHIEGLFHNASCIQRQGFCDWIMRALPSSKNSSNDGLKIWIFLGAGGTVTGGSYLGKWVTGGTLWKRIIAIIPPLPISIYPSIYHIYLYLSPPEMSCFAPTLLLTMMFRLVPGPQQRNQLTMDWNLWNHELQKLFLL